jgi:hypothetical protein
LRGDVVTSTAMYAAVTRKREEASEGTSESNSPPAVGRYVDSLAALVPSEVLAFYVGVAIPSLTTTEKNAATGVLTTTITNPRWLAAAFVFCLILSSVIYVGVHSLKEFDKWDLVRLAIPPIAFIAWAMLQTPSVFDLMPVLGIVSTTFSVDPKVALVIAAGIAIILGLATRSLATTADQKQPPAVAQPTGGANQGARMDLVLTVLGGKVLRLLVPPSRRRP